MLNSSCAHVARGNQLHSLIICSLITLLNALAIHYLSQSTLLILLTRTIFTDEATWVCWPQIRFITLLQSDRLVTIVTECTNGICWCLLILQSLQWVRPHMTSETTHEHKHCHILTQLLLSSHFVFLHRTVLHCSGCCLEHVGKPIVYIQQLLWESTNREGGGLWGEKGIEEETRWMRRGTDTPKRCLKSHYYVRAPLRQLHANTATHSHSSGPTTCSQL